MRVRRVRLALVFLCWCSFRVNAESNELVLLRKQMLELSEKVKSIEAEMIDIKKENVALRKQIDLFQETQNTGSHNDVKGKRQSKNETTVQSHGPVAFTAYLSANLRMTDRQHIIFDKTITSLGGGYTTHDGIFTAPVAGVYLFSFTVMNMEHTFAAMELVKNGERIVVAYGDSSDYNMGTQVITLELALDDKVWIQHFGRGNEVLHDLYNTFTGVLLFEKKIEMKIKEI